MPDLERPDSWKVGYRDALEFDHEIPNPWPTGDPDHYAWADGYREGIKHRQKPGFMESGFLFRDDCGEYWFYSEQDEFLRCLEDRATGLDGGDSFATLSEAKAFLQDGYFERKIRTLSFNEAWGLLPTEDK